MLNVMRASFTILAVSAFLSLSTPAFGQSASDVEALTKKEPAKMYLLSKRRSLKKRVKHRALKQT